MGFWSTALGAAVGFFTVLLLNLLWPQSVFKEGFFPAAVVYALSAYLLVYLPARKRPRAASARSKGEYIVDGAGQLTDTVFRLSEYPDYKQIEANAEGRMFIGPVGQILCTGYRTQAAVSGKEGRSRLHMLFLAVVAFVLALLLEVMMPSGHIVSADGLYQVVLGACFVCPVLSLVLHIVGVLGNPSIGVRRELMHFARETGWFAALFCVVYEIVWSDRSLGTDSRYLEIAICYAAVWLVLMIGGRIVKKRRPTDAWEVIRTLRRSAVIFVVVFFAVQAFSF